MNTKILPLLLSFVFLTFLVKADCPDPIITPGDTSLCGGGSSVLLTVSEGDSYQWMKNGKEIPGANDQTYLANRSANYSVAVTIDGCGTLTSNEVSISKNPLPKVFLSADGSNVFCPGDSITISANTFDVENPQYQWYRGGLLIVGATEVDYVVKTKGNYRVIITNAETGCSKKSEAMNVYVVSPSVTIIPFDDITFCPGSSVDLFAFDNVGFDAAYEWTRNGEVISGASDVIYNATLKGVYRVTVTSILGCSKTSRFVRLFYGNCRMEENNLLNEAVSIYPNPTKGILNIEYNGTSAAVAEVYNTLGQKVLTSIDKSQVNISTLPNGFYVVKLLNNNNEVIAISKVQKVD